jgi:hypothetical protein
MSGKLNDSKFHARASSGIQKQQSKVHNEGCTHNAEVEAGVENLKPDVQLQQLESTIEQRALRCTRCPDPAPASARRRTAETRGSPSAGEHMNLDGACLRHGVAFDKCKVLESARVVGCVTAYSKVLSVAARDVSGRSATTWRWRMMDTHPKQNCP